jgi:carbon storage regulator
MTISFDTSKLRTALRTYQLATLKDSHTVVTDAARNFVKRAASVTPPATGKLNSEAKKRGESIIIGDDIVITVVDIRGDKVRLGIAAPIEISVHRQEVYEAIQRENRQASRLEPQEARQV